MPQPSTEQETRPIESLIPYPRQSDVFDPLTEDELQQLAESIKQSGLQHPIDILPNGSVRRFWHSVIGYTRDGFVLQFRARQ